METFFNDSGRDKARAKNNQRPSCRGRRHGGKSNSRAAPHIKNGFSGFFFPRFQGGRRKETAPPSTAFRPRNGTSKPMRRGGGGQPRVRRTCTSPGRDSDVEYTHSGRRKTMMDEIDEEDQKFFSGREHSQTKKKNELPTRRLKMVEIRFNVDDTGGFNTDSEDTIKWLERTNSQAVVV
mmetsp:Transcript_36582/g.67597  ORF Transcript_36582/g.67597 Transcript_36582/m.67597 type:complete len:179 (-) Transcript_36582:241-777(-)